MMENTNEIQNTNDAMIRDMAQNVEKVDDADDFYYDQVDEGETSGNEMIYSTNPQAETGTVEIPEAQTLLTPDEDTEENLAESIPEVKTFQLTDEEMEKVAAAASEVKDEAKDIDVANFDALFNSLYSDVTGANNFIANLIEQKKTVNINESNLIEMREKLEKDKEEFAKYMEAQNEAIELEKAQCQEYVKTQRMRISNEETQFNSDVEATRAELALAEQTLKINNEKLADEKQQFSAYKELEEEKLKSDKQRLESEKSSFLTEKSITEEKLKSDRLKLETEKEQFMKEKGINDDKLSADRKALETEKEQFEKEKALDAEKLKNAQAELDKQKEQFAKYKELEEKKLELENKNLSQSCARFKELVSQFNSGFQQLPGEKE